MRLKNKIAWVTGAGSGIGRAAAVALAQEGATVIVSGRREGPLEQVAAEIKAAGSTAIVKAADLTNAAATAKIADEIRSQFKRLDILVNNAGVNIAKRSMEQLDAEGADQVLDGNLSNAFYCVIAALPMMRAQKDGILIHTASMAGRSIGPLSGAAYAAAKHGVVALSHSINCQQHPPALRQPHQHRLMARHKETGAWAGHTIVCVDEHCPGFAMQEDTSVVSAHRGHRLGMLLKATMLLWLRDAQPMLETIDTWNALSNRHMIAVNDELGCVVEARGAALQLHL